LKDDGRPSRRCQLPGTGTILNQLRARIDSSCTAEARQSGYALKIWHSRKKKKGQPLSQDGWLFFFVPIVAEILSVLKEAG